MKGHQQFQLGVLTRNFLPKLMPHHRQGTLDGACGFYCVSMILNYFEICDPERDVSDRRTNISRLLQHLSQGQPLLEKGLSRKQLKKEVLRFSPRLPMTFKERASGDPEQLRKFIRGRVRKAVPTILAYSGADYRHFAVTVGADQETIYLMDPAENWVDGMIYNESLKLYRYRGRVQARDSKGTPVQVGPCIAFCPKGWKLKRRHRRTASSG